MRINKLSLAWVLLNTCDFALTWAVISTGGPEIMPLAILAIRYGIVWFAIFKVLFTFGGLLVLRRFRPKLMQVCDTTFVAILCWNALALAINKI